MLVKSSQIFILIFLLLCIEGVWSRDNFYLIDTANFFQLTSNERILLDTTLPKYYRAQHDSDRIVILVDMFMEMNDNDVWIEYNQLVMDLVEKNIVESSEEDRIYYLNKKADALNNWGYYYNLKGDIPSALDMHYESLRIYEELKDKSGMAGAFGNLALIYHHQHDNDKALEYNIESIKLFREINDSMHTAIGLNNIASIYEENDELEKSLEYLQKSLFLKEAIKDEKGTASTINNIGFVYQKLGNSKLALEYYQRSLEIDKKTGDKLGMARTLNNIGHRYLDLGEVELALDNGHRSLQMGQELGYPQSILEPAWLLCKIHKKNRDYKQSLEMYELYIVMRDSINNEKNKKAAIRQQTKYEFEKAQLIKEQQMQDERRKLQEAQSRRDNLQYSVIIIVIVALFLSLLSVRPLGAVRPVLAEGLVFFVFLIFFEFLLVLADPYIDNWSGGAPGIKLLFNAGIAALIFPLHSLFESKLKGRIIKSV